MLDYRAIAALALVIETQNFQRAAEKLFITQSAVSQRIKSLEDYYGEPVVIRSLPLKPTHLGALLLAHYRQTQLLEDHLNESIQGAHFRQRLSAAISRDSLETWFVGIMDQLASLKSFTIDIIADDQDYTIQHLKSGVVSACVSTQSKSLPGYQVNFLGYLDYILVATPEFKRNFFKNTDQKESLLHAPAILFDHKDELHKKYLKRFFQMNDAGVHYHSVPSVAGFRQFALNGYAYALIPAIDIVQELHEQRLINLFPDKVWHMPLYWHNFSIQTEIYRHFNQIVLEQARQSLRQKL